ncbi:MAG: glutamate--tRNA ligase [Phycisphaerales bacterium]
MHSTPDGVPKTITRFAPSPTGHLHIGGARSALFCWAFARATGGHFILRLEDTDQARSSESSATGILHDLAWLGIDWDEGPDLEYDGRTIGGDPRSVGPFKQSDRLHLYNQQIDALIAKGLAYPAFESAEELASKRDAALAEKKTYRYDRAALQLTEADRRARLEAGEPHVVRFRAPDSEPIVVPDAVLGEVAIAPGELEDFVIRKQDGFPTYHLAVVVDDALMGVTHVLRGQEHLSNTPKHVALQRAMGVPVPVYAHMPLIFNDKGAKMSKRERDQVARESVRSAGTTASPIPDRLGDDELRRWLDDKKTQLDSSTLEALARAMNLALPEVSVEDFRAAGYLPEVINNFIALLGWTPPRNDDGSDREKFDMAFLGERFEIKDLGKSNARFDRAKLLSFNTDAITAMPPDRFVDRFAAWCAEYRPALRSALGEDRLPMLARAVQPQSRSFADAADRCAFAVLDPDEIEYDAAGAKKWLTKNDGEGLGLLREFARVLEQHADWSPESLHALVADFCARRDNLNMGKLAQPIRMAMTGTPISPAIGETLGVLGRDEAIRRIDRCLRVVSGGGSGAPGATNT